MKEKKKKKKPDTNVVLVLLACTLFFFIFALLWALIKLTRATSIPPMQMPMLHTTHNASFGSNYNLNIKLVHSHSPFLEYLPLCGLLATVTKRPNCIRRCVDGRPVTKSLFQTCCMNAEQYSGSDSKSKPILAGMKQMFQFSISTWLLCI